MKKTKAKSRSFNKLSSQGKPFTRKIKKPGRTDANKSSRKVSNKVAKKLKTLRPPELKRMILRPFLEDKPGRSFLQIVRKAPERPDIFNSADVSVLRYTGDRIKLGEGSSATYHKAIATKTVTRKDRGPDTTYKQIIFARDPTYKGALIDCPQIILHCQCARHQFMWEYALWEVGAANIITSNGNKPVETNPRMRAGCCKHAVMSYLKLKERKI